MAHAPYNILFLCDGNSARSIFGECLVRAYGAGRFQGYSAGQNPLGSVHPMTLQVLKEHGHDVAGLHSKSVHEFLKSGAPLMDFVFTVCERSDCATWPGSPITAEWKTEDPLSYAGPEQRKLWAFRRAYRELENRVRVFMSLKVESLDKLSLQKLVDEIGAASSPPSREDTEGLPAVSAVGRPLHGPVAEDS